MRRLLCTLALAMVAGLGYGEEPKPDPPALVASTPIRSGRDVASLWRRRFEADKQYVDVLFLTVSPADRAAQGRVLWSHTLRAPSPGLLGARSGSVAWDPINETLVVFVGRSAGSRCRVQSWSVSLGGKPQISFESACRSLDGLVNLPPASHTEAELATRNFMTVGVTKVDAMCTKRGWLVILQSATHEVGVESAAFWYDAEKGRWTHDEDLFK